MQPFSQHWADQTAVRIIKTRGEKPTYTVASGITPSGVVHVGNFREVITGDLIARALKTCGRTVRFIYSWDDFDTLRKVPANMPNPELLQTNLRRPISRVPDPFGTAASYADHHIRNFEAELAAVGIRPEFIYQHARYSASAYAAGIRRALEQRAEIRAILNEHRSEPLPDTWLPTTIYCETCDKDEMDYESYDGDWGYGYRCRSCGHETKTDIRKTRNLKLNWRTDWPMRWHHEGVDFEPGGKDHSSQGGSYDTGAIIVRKIWGVEPPVYLPYDFVMIKGGAGKMSSSSGELYTVRQVLEVYEPQILRWIFATHRPNHDFALAFDTDVIKLYDEFDRSEAAAFDSKANSTPKGQVNRRAYELSMLDGEMAALPPRRAGFRDLCNRLQICDGDVARTWERYYDGAAAGFSRPRDYEAFAARAGRAWTWLEKYADAEFRYRLRSARAPMPPETELTRARELLRGLVTRVDLATMDSKELNQAIYDQVIHAAPCEPLDFFRTIYGALIGRDQGPRLPAFMKEIGKEKLLELL